MRGCHMVATGTDISITLTTIFMKMSGLWMAANYTEQIFRNTMLLYTTSLILFAVGVQTTDFYYSWGDVSAQLYIMCNILSLTTSLIKITIIFLNRKDFFKLIVYMQKKFLNSNYDSYEEMIVDSSRRISTMFILSFTFFAQITVATYVIGPVWANIGKNDSERILPFRMWVNLPLTVTPYFEIMFTLQVLSVYQIGVCYFCFDNFLCIINLHVSGQFRILHYRLRNLTSGRGKEMSDIPVHSASKRYAVFKNCVQQHQSLIAYCDLLEHVFSSLVLGQVLLFSIVICLDGYQVLMAEATILRRLIFVFHTGTTMSQLLMFTYSCDCLIRESTNTSEAMFAAPWYYSSMSKHGKMLRNDMKLVILRSRIPCCLTARGFFVVSLETYTKVLSTAASYFTLLRQSTENAINNYLTVHTRVQEFTQLLFDIYFYIVKDMIIFHLIFQSRYKGFMPITEDLKKHQILISYYDKIAEICNGLALIQIITSSVSICLVGFHAFLFACATTGCCVLNLGNSKSRLEIIELSHVNSRKQCDHQYACISQALLFVMHFLKVTLISSCFLEILIMVPRSNLSFQAKPDKRQVLRTLIEFHNSIMTHELFLEYVAYIQLNEQITLRRIDVTVQTAFDSRLKGCHHIKAHYCKFNMTLGCFNDISLALTTPFMKMIGCWPARSQCEEVCRSIMRVITVILVFTNNVTHICDAIVVKVCIRLKVETIHLNIYSLHPLHFFVHILNTSLGCYKMSILLIYRKDFFKLITILFDKFLVISNYDAYERELVMAYKRISGRLIIVYTVFCQMTIFYYVMTPVLVIRSDISVLHLGFLLLIFCLTWASSTDFFLCFLNLHLNETDRIYMFKMPFPTLYLSPYFELMYVVQVLAFYQTCLCYFSADNFLFIFNMHLSCQFRILQYRFETLKGVNEDRSSSAKYPNGYYTAFKECILQHQELISYADRISSIYKVFFLIQTLTYSFLICLSGYHALIVPGSFAKHCQFLVLLLSTLWQLLMFCYGADHVKQESANVDIAVYLTPWPKIGMNGDGRMLWKSVNIVSLRARKPCVLSACGFFNVSLETFSKVLSTSLSYFALIRETVEG
ncbi:uncharacterized protein LOC143183408 [Calliopsis andreniformis]|uniref:uncharacterized protein LOC143183408 n=1 Tax=Calliopsis andreniformis TaxID=337506 RepID=UPI003FCCAEDB